MTATTPDTALGRPRNVRPLLPGPNVRLLGRNCPLFQAIGLAGWVLSITLAMATAAAVERSVRTVGLLAVVAFVTFLVLAVARKVVTGTDGLTYYHHVISVLALATVTIRLAGQPVLPYLDHTALGLVLFTVVGRIGCLMAGCCHGRPRRWGVRYGPAHVAVGFPAGLAEVPLFPIQLIEAAWVALVTVACTWFVLAGAKPGTALVVYLTAYTTGRFGLEFLRGDPGRAYVAGFSEAQWTSLVLLWALAAGGLGGIVPGSPWEPALAAALSWGAVAIAVQRRVGRSLRHRLRSARHLNEVAEAIERLERQPTDRSIPAIAETSDGLRVSLSEGAVGRHYALSLASRPLRPDEAKTVARLLTDLRPSGGRARVQQGRQGTFHVFVTVLGP